MNTAESKLVEYFAARGKLSPAKFPIGIGDDMAQVKLSGKSSALITTDILLDGVHFDSKKARPEQIGYKAMLCSLSDCAAMATVPIGAVVSVALPRDFGPGKLKKLHSGILKAAKQYDCDLIGGDMARWSGRLVVNVAMMSRPGRTKPVRRDTAKVDDIVCVTGALGGSIIRRHLGFQPRIKEALLIAKAGANAMIDISDGLSTDLNHICRMSKKGAVIEAEKIPISKDAKKSKNPLDSALNDGEDFELLFTIPKKKFESLKRRWCFKVKLTAVGKITRESLVKIKRPDGKTVKLIPGGYDHLRVNSKS
ncbi:MAG: thiamine-phosphate kinase [Sedimentisphaerales bacterium]|nr:thiamine-phosphate kinase [Sedimentisphaerales bacterium]